MYCSCMCVCSCVSTYGNLCKAMNVYVCVCVCVYLCVNVLISAQPHVPSVVSSSLCSVMWRTTGQQFSCKALFSYSSVIYLTSLVVQFFLFSLFFFFFGDLEQSAVQFFIELSNPALDLSRAAQPNRIVVLTLMTIPPAVAEPPVGHQEECAREDGRRGRSGRWLTERETDTDWQR